MHIQTGELITRRKLTPVPTTQPIIDAVEKLAKRQGMQKSFKIESRVDIPMVPAHWIAGVDHDLDNDNPAETNNDSDSDDDDYEPDDEDYYADDDYDEFITDFDPENDDEEEPTRDGVNARGNNNKQ